MRPIIGITPSLSNGKSALRQEYVNAVIVSGGTPVVLPITSDKSIIESYCRITDGLLFSGGDDVSPSYYGELPLNSSVVSDKNRDQYEMCLFSAFFSTSKPIFGICRGIQLINVALGGTLFQDISDHRQKEPRSCAPYSVSVNPSSLLFQATEKDTLSVNSFHHQSINVLAPSLRVTAVDKKDGSIEAVESSSSRYIVAVQWHPEDIIDASSLALFRQFVYFASKKTVTQ